jgi:hypothetical protein
MTSELAPLFEPIAARFDVQAGAIARLRADNAALAAEVAALRQHIETDPGDTAWTPIPPPDAAARLVHVSSSAGKNTNDGHTPDSPVESIAKALSLLRDNTGDRLLLRRGDTFRESFGGWAKSGRSPQQPLLITAYGDGPRPRVVSPGSAFSVLSAEPHDLALVGLHLTAAGRDPASPDFDPASPAGHGVRIIRPVANLLVEDCRIDHFVNNLTLTAGDGPGARLSNVRVRRCQILDAWSAGGAFSGQGLYATGCDGLLLEDNVFDHNGWNELVPGAAPNVYRHNLYLSAANTGVAVRGNVIANASSHGLQLRGGGDVSDNLFLSNALHCLIAGPRGRFRNNVVLGGRDIDAHNPRGFGLTLACADGLAERNLFAQKPATTGGALAVQRGEWTPPGPMHAAFVANLVHGWSGNGLDVTGDCGLLEFVGNDLQLIAPGRKLVTVKASVGRLRFAANRYDAAEKDRDKWFLLNDLYLPQQQWTDKTGDTSRFERAAYANPQHALPADFLARARAQSRQTWDPRATAAVAIRDLRRAFDL